MTAGYDNERGEFCSGDYDVPRLGVFVGADGTDGVSCGWVQKFVRDSDTGRQVMCDASVEEAAAILEVQKWVWLRSGDRLLYVPTKRVRWAEVI
jgi:hypothetical protein